MSLPRPPYLLLRACYSVPGGSLLSRWILLLLGLVLFAAYIVGGYHGMFIKQCC